MFSSLNTYSSNKKNKSHNGKISLQITFDKGYAYRMYKELENSIIRKQYNTWTKDLNKPKIIYKWILTRRNRVKHLYL